VVRAVDGTTEPKTAPKRLQCMDLVNKGERIRQRIHAMVSIGPWLLHHIDYSFTRERCEISKTPILWIYVMEKQTEPRITHRIGSECGPRLESVSEELWGSVLRPYRTSRQHVLALQKLLSFEASCQGTPKGYEPGWALQQLERLSAGINQSERQRMGRELSHASQLWGRWARLRRGG
jgi:hypothetical protein